MKDILTYEGIQGVLEYTHEFPIIILTGDNLQKLHYKLLKELSENQKLDVFPLENANFDNIRISLEKAFDVKLESMIGTDKQKIIGIFRPEILSEYTEADLMDILRILVRLSDELIDSNVNIMFFVTDEFYKDLSMESNNLEGKMRRLCGLEVILR